jgi:hypothetical protein
MIKEKEEEMPRSIQGGSEGKRVQNTSRRLRPHCCYRRGKTGRSSDSSSWKGLFLFFSLHPEARRKHRRDKRRKIVLPVTLCSDLDKEKEKHEDPRFGFVGDDSNPMRSLPGEGFLEDVNLRVCAPVTDGLADVVGQAAGTADTDGHGADLLFLLLLDKGTAVGLAREHLYAGAGRVDLLGAARAGDEEEDAEDVATLLHAEDLGHPGTDPFEVLGRLNDPDKGDLASGVGAVGVTGDEVTNVRNLVGDTDTGSEKHDGTV